MIFFFFVYSYTKNTGLGRLYLAVALIFLLGDILKWKNNPTEKAKVSSWYIGLGITFFLSILLEVSLAMKVVTRGYMEYMIFTKLLCTKNVIFISVVLLINIIVCMYWKEKMHYSYRTNFLYNV